MRAVSNGALGMSELDIINQMSEPLSKVNCDRQGNLSSRLFFSS